MKIILTTFAIFFISLSNCGAQEKFIAPFIPEGMMIIDKIGADLNYDGEEDLIVLVKNTMDSLQFTDEHGLPLDLNKRGIIILLKQQGEYFDVSHNYNAIPSGNESRINYSKPAMDFTANVSRANVVLHFDYKDLGYKEYTFRYIDSTFVLINYEESEKEGLTNKKLTLVNFLPEKKMIRIYNNELGSAESTTKKYVETWMDINVEKLVKLSEIQDFDSLDISQFR